MGRWCGVVVLACVWTSWAWAGRGPTGGVRQERIDKQWRRTHKALAKLQKMLRVEAQARRVQRELAKLRGLLEGRRGPTSRSSGLARPPALVRGISRQLARFRKAQLKHIRYRLQFVLHKRASAPFVGELSLEFRLTDARRPVWLDFQGTLLAAKVQGRPVKLSHRLQHIELPAKLLRRGNNRVWLRFQAAPGSISRRVGFVYTLFVPDKASRAFPCFDQPDLKSRFTLRLRAPLDWEAVTNAPLSSRRTGKDHRWWSFSQSQKIPTYLFAFAAGRFSVETVWRGGRRIRVYHRVDDRQKVRRNLKAIADLHGQSLRTLEAYTQIPMPYAKFDVVLIPSFPYGGMEHPGSIFYRSSTLMLGASATPRELLRRASLIAHETAHMWFGNLVTMRWFNDVWMKEVFANFMAAKIMHPSFPKIDHRLNFFLSHYRQAYQIDRSSGTHPIRQPLGNLNDASSLYGSIIYKKAPIAMQHLEALMGPVRFRKGVRMYLRLFAHGNADWSDLIQILDREYSGDLKAWSRIWIDGAGRPTIQVVAKRTAGGRLRSLKLRMSDPAKRRRIWPQRLKLALLQGSSRKDIALWIDKAEVVVPGVQGLAAEIIMPHGAGYGYFALDRGSLKALLHKLPGLPTALLRAVAWSSLWDAMLEAQIKPRALLELGLRALAREADALNASRILRDLRSLFWRFLTPSQRKILAPKLEAALWKQITTSSRHKLSFYDAFVDVAHSPSALAKLERLWGSWKPAGVALSQKRWLALGYGLALRKPQAAKVLLSQLKKRIRSGDQRRGIRFVSPVFSPDARARAAFVESLKSAKVRSHERWVATALRYLHHPLRAKASLKYVLPGLKLLKAVKATGKIFFPLRWLRAILGGRQSPAAAQIVAGFLAGNTAASGYPPRLRLKLQQAADPLFRAATIAFGWKLKK